MLLHGLLDCSNSASAVCPNAYYLTHLRYSQRCYWEFSPSVMWRCLCLWVQWSSTTGRIAVPSSSGGHLVLLDHWSFESSGFSHPTIRRHMPLDPRVSVLMTRDILGQRVRTLRCNGMWRRVVSVTYWIYGRIVYALKIEAADSSETLGALSFQTTRRNMPEASDEVGYCKAKRVGMYCGRYVCRILCCLQAFFLTIF